MAPTPRHLRIVLGLLGALLAGFGLALLLRVEPVKRLWIWPAAPEPNHAFVGSVALAVAAQMLWIARTGWLAALRPSAWNLIVFAGGASQALFRSAAYASDGRVRAYAWLAAGAALAGVGVLVALRRARPGSDVHASRAVRLAFGAFAVLLVSIGTALLLGAPRVFPWPLGPDAAQVYAWIALGSGVFFAHLALTPSARTSRGALLGFLAYDVAVLLPLLTHAFRCPPGHGLSLAVYLAVVLVSGTLAVATLGRRVSL